MTSISNPQTLNTELLRLLARYSEAYFSRTGADLPDAQQAIEAYIAKERLLAQAETVESLVDEFKLYMWGPYDPFSVLNGELNLIKKDIATLEGDIQP